MVMMILIKKRKRRQKLKFVLPIVTHVPMPSDNQNMHDLQKKIQQLERQLEDEKLRSELYLRIIEKAEAELKIQIKKSPPPSDP